MMIDFHHLPVMPDEAVHALNIRTGGVYVDGTLGGGGHAKLILERLPAGTLVGIDRDPDALVSARDGLCYAASRRDTSLITIQGNFHDMPVILRAHGIDKIDGVLLDLGVSSHQLDTPQRGFSYRSDGPLDMRMDPYGEGLAARDIVNTYSQGEITRILYEYGEERYAPRIARAICAAREKAAIETTRALVDIIGSCLPKSALYGDKHPAMRTFMALRIAVNDELAPLKDVMRQITGLLNPGGRFAVITFHSLEDRIVKHTFKSLANPCDCPRDIPYCVCGKPPQVRIVTRSPIVPASEEIARNSRASSAKLRVAEKII